MHEKNSMYEWHKKRISIEIHKNIANGDARKEHLKEMQQKNIKKVSQVTFWQS
jgi:hypothetical protein